MRIQLVVLSLLTAVFCIQGWSQESAAISADARRGEQLFTSHSCDRCHSIKGKGGTTAPDLGKRIGRGYTPATLAAVMWNHAPKMWSAMRQQNIEANPLDRQEAADLLGYFYSVRFFDRPADAARGRRVFEEKRCVECHGVTAAAGGSAKPVTQWDSLGDPMELTAAMWAHSVNMRDAFAAKKIKWPELSGQDVSDLHIYARNLPGTRGKPSRFTTAGTNGEALFQSKGCTGCHTGKLELGPRLHGKTMSDIAAAMWSHASKMGAQPPSLTRSEMEQIVSFLWREQVLGTDGSVNAGRKIFVGKGCAGCHGASAGAAPNLAKREGQFSTVSMISALWQHGPQMLERMKQNATEWPRFTAQQMEDLIAYLNAGD